MLACMPCLHCMTVSSCIFSQLQSVGWCKDAVDEVLEMRHVEHIFNEKSINCVMRIHTSTACMDICTISIYNLFTNSLYRTWTHTKHARSCLRTFVHDGWDYLFSIKDVSRGYLAWALKEQWLYIHVLSTLHIAA